MTETGDTDFKGRTYTPFLLLAAFILVIYSNTFDASWHLDDYHTIIRNPRITINDLYPDTLKKTFKASYDQGRYEGNTVYRPVAMLSFALNWYGAKDDVTAYHVVNTGIHILTSFFLYLVMLNLLNTPNIREKDRGKRHFIALAASLMWAAHPIQVQAVTYIVQRMACLSALFYIAAVYAYIRARNSRAGYQKAGWTLILVVLFLLGVGCKENTALLPAALLMTEFVFFRDWETVKKQKKEMVPVLIFCGFILFLSAWLLLNRNFTGVIERYDQRPYGMLERLATQPRVLMFYLYQVICPVADHFSIAHDFEPSLSFFSPPTTLPAAATVLFLMGASLLLIQKLRVPAFAVAFFFLNHAVESTILPLEMVFEHRNYLPTMFLFMPVSSGLYAVLERCRKNGRKTARTGIIALVTLLLWAIGIGTHARNFVWKTEASLWADAVEKAPLRARPHQLLGYQYYSQKVPRYEKAAELYARSVGLRSDRPVSSARNAYDKLSLIFSAQKKYDLAVAYGLKAVKTDPADNRVRLRYVLALIDAGRLETALDELAVLVKRQPDNAAVFNTKTRILMKLGRPQQAEQSVLMAMKLDPLGLQPQTYFAAYQFRARHHTRAEFYFQRLIKRVAGPNRIHFYLILVENCINAGWEAKKQGYISALLSEFSLDAIQDKLSALAMASRPEVPLSPNKLADAIAANILDTAGRIPDGLKK